MSDVIIKRLVSFLGDDFEIVKAEQNKRGLGKKGFSQALRIIVREWKELTEKVKYEVEGRPESGRQAPQMEAEDGD